MRTKIPHQLSSLLQSAELVQHRCTEQCSQDRQRDLLNNVRNCKYASDVSEHRQCHFSRHYEVNDEECMSCGNELLIDAVDQIPEPGLLVLMYWTVCVRQTMQETNDKV